MSSPSPKSPTYAVCHLRSFVSTYVLRLLSCLLIRRGLFMSCLCLRTCSDVQHHALRLGVRLSQHHTVFPCRYVLCVSFGCVSLLCICYRQTVSEFVYVYVFFVMITNVLFVSLSLYLYVSMSLSFRLPSARSLLRLPPSRCLVPVLPLAHSRYCFKNGMHLLCVFFCASFQFCFVGDGLESD